VWLTLRQSGSVKLAPMITRGPVSTTGSSRLLGFAALEGRAAGPDVLRRKQIRTHDLLDRTLNEVRRRTAIGPGWRLPSRPNACRVSLAG
jgi:hypothetical protein